MGTILKIALFDMSLYLYTCILYIKQLNSHMETFHCRIHVLMTIIDGGLFTPLAQTLNCHIKTGTDSLIRLIGGPTVKWSQLGSAHVLTFLESTFFDERWRPLPITQANLQLDPTIEGLIPLNNFLYSLM